MNVVIRPETARDHSAVRKINDLAFGHNNESILIGKLRKLPGFIPELSLVAESGGRAVGYILFYPVAIVNVGVRHPALALAPMCVHPAYQRSGVGKKLLREGLQRAAELGYGAVVVVGHPEYYPRFGFKRLSSFGIRSPFNVPEDVALAIELTEGSLKGVRGIVEYPEPFYETL